MKYSLLLITLISVTSLVAAAPKTIENYDRMDSIDVQLVDMDTKVSGMDTKVIGIDTKVTGIDTKMTDVESKIASLETKVDEVTKNAKVEKKASEEVLSETTNVRISVTGQGVAPMNTLSPAQAYALAKRAATADAYRLIAEKVKGVRIDGQDLIKNMMVKRSTIRTSVKAMVRNANVVETTFKDGLCEVEMEIVLSHAQFSQ
ncbi:LPP20 family lipoprotein [Sulfurimonas sp.]|uniref:LPP20 family lipoprotein n=1 Tax=Sulfurimonas sp. TaxID=2022749 RepID=UPI002B463709|nr:LPP20 family lipoprotein [Sulfurimonas sp.]